jgi:DNA-binding response OmpR family regulator
VPTSLKVLIIEDDDLCAQTIAFLLQECGNYVSERVSTLAAALETLKQKSFDFIICDLGLPDSRGVQTVIEVKKYTVLPVIVLSGTDVTSVVISTLRSIADSFILKQQFTLENLRSSLRDIGKIQ